MSTAAKKRGSKSSPEALSELAPDAWQHFERAIDVVAKAPPACRCRHSARALCSRAVRHRGGDQSAHRPWAKAKPK
jgi:hypothetical protein